MFHAGEAPLGLLPACVDRVHGPSCQAAAACSNAQAFPCLCMVVALGSCCRRRYDYVMVTDDDLVMDSCTIDLFFEARKQREGETLQPSCLHRRSGGFGCMPAAEDACAAQAAMPAHCPPAVDASQPAAGGAALQLPRQRQR